jgi:hypothetical protein
MPFTGGPPAAYVQAQQRAVLNEVLTGIFLRAGGGENEKGRREAGLSVFCKFSSDDQYFATTGPGPQLKR